MTTPQPDYAEGGIVPAGPAPEPFRAGERVISREQLDALGEAAVRRVLDRLNAPARHDLDDVAREFGIDLDDEGEQ